MKKKLFIIALAMCLMPGVSAMADTFEATVQGFGGDVTVCVEAENGKLVSVTATGDKETQGIGSVAVDTLPAKMLEAGTYDVDGVSGCTISGSAVKMAAKAAMIKAGILTDENASVAMKPGVYHGESTGFAKFEMIKLDVTVDETKILSIDVNMEENGETKPIFQMAVDTLIPRVLDARSVRVDSVTGATASCAGLKSAIESALTQALSEGGSDKTAIENFYSVPEKTKAGVETELTADVLVIGMGGSGTYAATRAAEAGASVLAIDKMNRYGGTTALTSEVYAINPTRVQNEYNEGKNFVDVDGMRAQWLAYTEGDAKESMVDYMMTVSGTALDWLVYEHGFQFDYSPKNGFTADDEFPVKYQFIPNNIGYNKEFIAAYFDGIIADYENLGGQYMLETEGYELLTDENGDVVGAKARNLYTGEEFVIHAKSVILATGGFAGNGEMETKYLAENPYFDLAGEWKCYGNMTNDGKMIEAALNIGAGTYNIGVAPMVHNAGIAGSLDEGTITHVEGKLGRKTGRPEVWSTADVPLFMASYMANLTVNKNGERFTNEEKTAHLNSWISGPRYYTLWTKAQVELLTTEGFTVAPGGRFYQYLGYQGEIPQNTPLADAMDVVERYVAAGLMYKADTPEELAGMIGCDPAVLTATVSTYNTACANGVDEQFGKSSEYLRAIDNGPFYAVVGAPYCYSTCGGLDINDDFVVLKADGVTPIKGLYAVGTDSMGVLFTEKKAYVTYGGAANGWALTSGYLCGEKAAEAALAQ